MSRFVGRKQEIKTILSSFNDKKGTLITLKGRRRIGKSTLIKELKKRDDKITLRYLTSIPPKNEISDEVERKAYADQVRREFNLSYDPPSNSWQDLIYFIVDQCIQPFTILAIDEVNWLARKSKVPLENILWEVWERKCSEMHNFMLILSGSLASWLQEHIIANEGFVGRIAHNIVLKELELNTIREFFGAKIEKIPNRDLIKILCAFGGVPLYLEYINPTLTAEENIFNLSIKETGPLNDEFNQMFSELFSNENKMYRRILEQIGLSSGGLSAKEVANKIGSHYTGRINDALQDLTDVGFIKKQTSWSIKDSKSIAKHKFKIADNYTAFFFRCINKQNQTRLRTGIEVLPDNLASILGLQFENLVEHNVRFVLAELKIKNPVYIGGFFQTKTTQQEGCQIDLLIQTKHRVYICECKLLSDPVKKGVISEVKQKISRLKVGRDISVCPVLIHSNGVEPSIENEEYFYHIIDMNDALKA